MKKFLAIILALAMFLPIAGCKKEQKPLRVVVDIRRDEIYVGDYVGDMEDKLKAFYENMKLFVPGTPEDVEFEVLPQLDGENDAERKSRLTRIRTEMMAGEGPDLFIVSSNGDDSLFLMPEKSMELGLLYPLDDLIEDAQFMEWDNLNQQVMAAGHSEEYGQVILPLSYTFPVTYFQKSNLNEVPEGDTWQDVLNDDTGILQVANVLQYNNAISGTLATSFGQVADYQNRKLLFTEEELLARVNEFASMEVQHRNGAFKNLPDFFHWRMCVDFEYENWRALPNGGESEEFLWSFEGINDWQDLGVAQEALTLVPAYNDQGGVTATVMTFGAINANSKRAKDAFLFLDYLLSEAGQSQLDLTTQMTDGVAIPVCDTVMTEAAPVKSLHGSWYLTDGNYQEFCRVKEQISAVRFYGKLDQELQMMTWYACDAAEGDGSNGTVEEIVHRYYTTMRQEVSE